MRVKRGLKSFSKPRKSLSGELDGGLSQVCAARIGVAFATCCVVLCG